MSSWNGTRKCIPSSNGAFLISTAFHCVSTPRLPASTIFTDADATTAIMIRMITAEIRILAPPMLTLGDAD